jgi:hypothetical protein
MKMPPNFRIVERGSSALMFSRFPEKDERENFRKSNVFSPLKLVTESL